MRIRTIAGAILLWPLLVFAQQKPAIPTLAEAIEVSLVNIDVVVTNKAGERVHRLTKDDFEIFENGHSQPITNFAEYSGATPAAPLQQEPPSPATAPAPPAQKRTVIVFVERFFLPGFRTDPFFASIKKLLHDAIRPGDRAMIVTWNRGVLLTAQPFTDSLSALDDAVDAVAKLSSKPVLDLRQETRWMIDFARGFDDQAAASGMSTNGNGVSDMEMDYIAQIEKQAQMRKARTINALIRAIAADEGKKIMLLVTHRLSRQAGAETYYRNKPGEMIPLEKQEAASMSAALKMIDDAANANGVTVYPLFPEGLETTMTDSSESTPLVTVADYQALSNETSALREIAEQTGGLAAWGGDTTNLLPRVRDDLESYYSLAYRLRNTGADKARKIVVKTRDPDLVVRSRRGYMEKSDATRMEDRVIAALFSNPPSPGFPLHVTLGERRARGRQTIIPLRIQVPVSVLTQLPQRGEYAGAFSVYFAWGGMLGGISDTSHQTRTYAISVAQFETARATGHITYDIELAVDQKTERLAFGVEDEISKEFALRLIRLR